MGDKSIDPIVDADNYVNPRWSTSSYTTIFDKFTYILKKIFFFAKDTNFFKFLVKIKNFIRNKIVNARIAKNLKKYFF